MRSDDAVVLAWQHVQAARFCRFYCEYDVAIENVWFAQSRPDRVCDGERARATGGLVVVGWLVCCLISPAGPFPQRRAQVPPAALGSPQSFTTGLIACVL